MNNNSPCLVFFPSFDTGNSEQTNEKPAYPAPPPVSDGIGNGGAPPEKPAPYHVTNGTLPRAAGRSGSFSSGTSYGVNQGEPRMSRANTVHSSRRSFGMSSSVAQSTPDVRQAIPQDLSSVRYSQEAPEGSPGRHHYQPNGVAGQNQSSYPAYPRPYGQPGTIGAAHTSLTGLPNGAGRPFMQPGLPTIASAAVSSNESTATPHQSPYHRHQVSDDGSIFSEVEPDDDCTDTVSSCTAP